LRRLLLAAGLCLAGLLPAQAAVLERVVILQRHGVRAPTKAPQALAPFAQQAWAVWPVAPGELTSHGAEALAAMGQALRRRYAGLLTGGDCTRTYVWADNADQRTRDSGKVMAAALAPGCDVAHWASGNDDVLFHGDRLCPADPDAAQAAVTARLAPLLAAHRQSYDRARRTLSHILSPDLTEAACKDAKAANCSLLEDATGVKQGGALSGTLSDASTLSENLYLEEAQGMPAPGWGRLTSAGLASIMKLHNLASTLTRKTPILAAHNATRLAQEIAALLDGTAAPVAVPSAARLVLLAGHDTNLSNIAALLGLNWTLAAQPDETAPDTAMAFERWRDGDRRLVRIRLYYQTVQELRRASPLPGGPHRRELALPACGKNCDLARFTARLHDAAAQECLAAP
jgi:4-phytase/acid phosphatase